MSVCNLYSVEEIPGKELIAARRLREGIILKYSTFYEDEREGYTARHYSDAYLNSRIIPARKKAYIGDPLITKQFKTKMFATNYFIRNKNAIFLNYLFK